jgi:hypothetical protein
MKRVDSLRRENFFHFFAVIIFPAGKHVIKKNLTTRTLYKHYALCALHPVHRRHRINFNERF